MLKSVLIGATTLATLASGETYFKETFDASYEDRWTVSDWKESEGQNGKWVRTAGKNYGDKEEAQGLQTSQDARFYAISAPLTKTLNNEGKDLVLQFQIKHEQKIDCGGGYIKLFPKSTDQAHLTGDSDYNIMFGPDICGTSTKRVHAIFNYKGDNKLIKKEVKCETDELSHVYTLIVHPNQTYEIRIDGEKKQDGSMLEDWDFLPAKEIKDPEQSKPKDWVDDAMMDDPEDKKPEGYDDIAKTIVDPDAEKPDDWDDEDDGEWEAPTVDNPEYKGPWSAKRVENPAYKGVWEHPMIANPEYKEDTSIYQSDSHFVGFDLWQVKAGSVFDNIIVTDTIAEAEAFMAETWGKNHEGEKEMKEAADKIKREEEEAERKRIDEERKAQEEEDDDDEDDDDDDDDDDEDEEEPEKDEL